MADDSFWLGAQEKSFWKCDIWTENWVVKTSPREDWGEDGRGKNFPTVRRGSAKASGKDLVHKGWGVGKRGQRFVRESELYYKDNERPLTVRIPGSHSIRLEFFKMNYSLETWCMYIIHPSLHPFLSCAYHQISPFLLQSPRPTFMSLFVSGFALWPTESIQGVMLSTVSVSNSPVAT